MKKGRKGNSSKIAFNRRDFLRTGAAAGLAAAAPGELLGRGPMLLIQKSVKPVIVSSANGNVFKNGGTQTGIEKAFAMMTGGSDILASLIAGVNVCELDPLEDSVGYGGLPNADGVVQLDSCCMHGPTRRAGGVACLEGVRTPSLVAYAVMQNTDHHLIVGKGAQDFARNMGFKIEDDINTEHSRKMWLEWKRRIDPSHYLDPTKRAAEVDRVNREMIAEGLIRARHLHGTINCNGVNARGEIAGVTTTSGLAWKIPGRVGDSPILGAGLYVDGDVGAAGSTGRGEANLYNLCSYLIVESLRAGMHPKDAGMVALKRIKANTVEKRLLRSNGDPSFNINFYILNAKGEYAGVAMYGEDEADDRRGPGQRRGRRVRYAVCTENGPQLLQCEGLLKGTSRD
jgi:N4-(beta-N-acetylglucosaminyl)-L-asparaginase